jgi:hypothetical protein
MPPHLRPRITRSTGLREVSGTHTPYARGRIDGAERGTARVHRPYAGHPRTWDWSRPEWTRQTADSSRWTTTCAPARRARVGRRGRGRQPPVHPCLVARLPDPEGQPDRRRRGHHRTSRSLHGVVTPELVRVGMTETEARRTGRGIVVAPIPVSAIPGAKTLHETTGNWKAVVDATPTRSSVRRFSAPTPARSPPPFRSPCSATCRTSGSATPCSPIPAWARDSTCFSTPRRPVGALNPPAVKATTSMRSRHHRRRELARLSCVDLLVLVGLPPGQLPSFHEGPDDPLTVEIVPLENS